MWYLISGILMLVALVVLAITALIVAGGVVDTLITLAIVVGLVLWVGGAAVLIGTGIDHLWI